MIIEITPTQLKLESHQNEQSVALYIDRAKEIANKIL